MLWSIRYGLLRWLLRLVVRCGLDELDLENAVLRHQLKILRRGGGRPRWTDAESGVPGSRRPAALPRPVDELPRRLRHPGEVASRAIKEETRTCVPPARPPAARSRDQEADRSARSRESPVGVPPDPGRAPEARRRRLGDDHRHGASRERPRPGAPSDRANLGAVPQAAGLRPPLPRCLL